MGNIASRLTNRHQEGGTRVFLNRFEDDALRATGTYFGVRVYLYRFALISLQSSPISY